MEYKVFLEDISEDLIDFVKFIGIDTFLEICEHFGGNQIYFPKKESIIRYSRNRTIRNLYNGRNAQELSKQFRITKGQVKNIVK